MIFAYVQRFKEKYKQRKTEKLNYKREPMQLLELRNTLSEMKIVLNVVNSSLNTRKDQLM